MKQAIVHPCALEAIRRFPPDIRYRLGKAVYLLQQGESLALPLSRPMPDVAPGAAELRLRDGNGIYRTFYYARSEKGILIVHSFVKKTQKTPTLEMKLARMRLRELLNG